MISLGNVTRRAARRGYAAAKLVFNDLTPVRVLPALDWWAPDAAVSSSFQSAPLRLAADVVLAHRAFTLSGKAAFTHPCHADSPATVRGALTLSGIAGVELTGGGAPVLAEAAVSCDGAFTLSASAAAAAFFGLPIGAAAVTVTGHALVPGRRRGFHAAVTSRSLALHQGQELGMGLVPAPAAGSFDLAGEIRFATVDKHHGEALAVMATAKLHLAIALPRRLAVRLASQTVQWAAGNEHRNVEPPTRQWTLDGELLLNLGEGRDLVADGAKVTALAATVDVAPDGALTARFAARLPEGGAGTGSLGVPVGRGLRVAGGTLTMNATFAAPTVSPREEDGAPALTALTGFIRGKAEFERFDHMFGDLFSRQHLIGHAGMSAALEASTAFTLTGGGAGSADRSATEAHTVVAATLWSAPGGGVRTLLATSPTSLYTSFRESHLVALTSYDAASVIAPTLALGASLSFAARGSFAFPCAGHARLATTATLRLGSGFTSAEHAGVLKWACGAPAAGAPKAVLSGVIAAPAAVGAYRFLGQSHYTARATVASALAGSELLWSGVLEGTLAAAAGAHGSADVLRLAFDAHLGTFGLAAAQKKGLLVLNKGGLGAAAASEVQVEVATSWMQATLAVDEAAGCSGAGSAFTGEAALDLAWLDSVGPGILLATSEHAIYSINEGQHACR